MFLLPAILTLFSTLVLAENNEYVMVELDPVYYGRSLVKRQVQYAEPVQQAQPEVQYVSQPGQEQITPEYYRYLQQVQDPQYQQPQITPELNQVLSSRAPQRFQQLTPPRRAQIPEEVRRLQESFAQRPLREQEREDQTNQQLNALGINPANVRRQRLRESAQRLAAQQAQEAAARQAAQAAEQHYQQLLTQPQHLVPPQLVPVPQEIPVQQAQSAQQSADRVSYSQVAFGTTKLPQQRIIPGRTQQIFYTHTQAQPQEQPTQPPVVAYRQPQPQQQVTYQPQYVYTQERPRPAQPQQFVYVRQPVKVEPQPQYSYVQQPERSASVAYQPQQQVQYAQPQAEVTQKQHPQQYLIETTKHEPEQQQQLVSIPRRQQFSYRPQANYQDFQAALAAQQQRAHISRQQEEAAASTTPAPRSAIYVTTARTPAQKAYAVPEYRIPNQESSRPLTETELNALINAGFSVNPTRSEDEYAQQYYRGLSKRQNTKPRIGKVQLTEQEREVLAKNGIRNLYRVQTAESQDAPITYVLAVENQKRDTEKSTSS